MLKKLAILATALMWVNALAFAQDVLPPMPPTPAVPTLKAPDEASGTGTKTDPYIFTKSTRCIFELVGDIPKDTVINWDKDDAPSDTKILDNKYANFSLYENGKYQLTVWGGTVYSKVHFMIKSGTDPPVPDPNVDPDVDPPVEPVVFDKLWVVIVKDDAKLSKLPSSQMQALLSQKMRDYCATHCRMGADGKTPEFKIYEPDTKVEGQSAGIQKAFKQAIEDRNKAGTTDPWITISNGKTGYSGPFELTEELNINRLKKYGGP